MNTLNKIYEKLYIEFLTLVDCNEDMMSATIGETNIEYESVVQIIERIFELKCDSMPYDWRSDVWAENRFYSFRIGVTEIGITWNKSLLGLISEIMAAILDGIAVKNRFFLYFSLINNTYSFEDGPKYDDKEINSMDVHELIKLVNDDQYCDSDLFFEMMASVGIEICKGTHPDLGPCIFIDTSKFEPDSKIWLYVGVNTHTLYKEMKPRLIVEVLYHLKGFYMEEAWDWCKEF